VAQTLIALDTDHIKQYVFPTDKLKEIRGGSSVLDGLNREDMERIKGEIEKEKRCKIQSVYTNGGSGMFLVMADKEVAEEFGRRIQKAYTRETQGGATISFATQFVPDDVKLYEDPDTKAVDPRAHGYLRLLTYRLIQAKMTPAETTSLLSQPLLRYCDACGIRHAEKEDRLIRTDPTESSKRFCAVCLAKRDEDEKVRKGIGQIIKERASASNSAPAKAKTASDQKSSYIWQTIIKLVQDEKLQGKKYNLPEETVRPKDFNELRGIPGSKDYLALIYADGNAMGQTIDECRTLTEREAIAKRIDMGVYVALSKAIVRHLPVVPIADASATHMFPFDILLIGGDDIVIVVPAASAMDVAQTVAEEFHKYTRANDSKGLGHTLSVGVVLAPIKYPFGLLHDLAESTLKFAKTQAASDLANEGQRAKERAAKGLPVEDPVAREKLVTDYRETRINFLVVAGSTSHDFKIVYSLLHTDKQQTKNPEFYATLRPYTVEALDLLLNAIREGRRQALGRTKLHQMREAILKMNLTTSVHEARAILRNWHDKQRGLVAQRVYLLAERYQKKYHDPQNPALDFPQVTFPWFADGPQVYRTPLLDFVELYDFVGGSGGDEN
jgi:hypothetical protein